MKISLVVFLSLFLFGIEKHIAAQAAADKAEKSSRPLSEIQFRVTDKSLGKARLFPEKVEETVLPDPYGCLAPQGGKEIRGKFRLEFEVNGNRITTYTLDLTFVEEYFWEPRLKKSTLPLTGQSKEQVVIIQYETCNTIEALLFGYDIAQKKIVRYSFSDNEPWRVSLSVGTRSFPDGRVQVLEPGKPSGVLQKRLYSNVVWGTFLDRYIYDSPLHQFFKIPMVVGMRVHPDPGPGGRPSHEIVLFEDGYMTDMRGRDKIVSKKDVYQVLASEEAQGILRLREKSGEWLQSEFPGDWPQYDFFFTIANRTFWARCGQPNCPKELQFMRSKIIHFWGAGR